MVVCESSINNIMGGIENTGGVTLHNHRRKLKQRFDIIKKLGQGTYGKVQLGINKETGQEVAIKTIKKCKIETEADLIRIRREIQIMSSVQHPNIIHIYEVFENREKMVLVMEYAAGGELYDYLSERKVLSEDEARRIFRQIATAVYYCHKHKICHRDLKLENILLDENGSAKIADFGLSNVFDERRLLSTFCGSPLYASPEIVKGTPYHGPEVDCWSLGVLLYTLVYGAMPFDGSNFKRLVKQISQGDYFEPKKPSSASPLIREMLTVVPEKRANIEKICAHWWVNANYSDSCLDIAEELANQTPVRLDLLLSLAPPPPQVGSDKLVIAGESSSMVPPVPESTAPARSQSVGSLMELVPPAERRIRDLVSDDVKQSPKRKLEVTVSTENANLSNSGAKRKEKPTKKEGETTREATESLPVEDSAAANSAPLNKNLTQTLVKEKMPEEVMASEEVEDTDPALQGAACSELIEEARKNEGKERKKSVKVVKKKVEKPATAVPVADSKTAALAENKLSAAAYKPGVVAESKPSRGDVKEKKDTETKVCDKENAGVEDGEKKEDTKIPVKRKVVVKKKVLGDKSNVLEDSVAKSDEKSKADKQQEEVAPAEVESAEVEAKKEEVAVPPSKPVERRRSKIFETAEKFQNLLTSNSESKPSVLEKPKKIFIPGVNVGGFKKEFERKASLTSSAAPDLKKALSKKAVPGNTQQTTNKLDETPKTEDKPPQPPPQPSQPSSVVNAEPQPKEVEEPSDKQSPEAEGAETKDQQRKKNAVNIISNAISKEGTRKSKSRPCMMRKPPVPFGINGRSASGSIGLVPSQFSPTIAKSSELSPEDNKKSSCEITLKSATLPRRRTSTAQIHLDYAPPKPAQMEFKTEMATRIDGQPLKTQRSEIIVPVKSNATTVNNNRLRSTSVDPEIKPKESPKERIIPISFEKEDNVEKPEVSSPQAKPPMPKPFQTQRPQRFGSVSRQSTHDSDSEATVSENMEPIRKSPREYIIPIAMEGGGYVTPRATSLEPSETSSRRSMPRTWGSRPKRMGSDEELSFASLHRHNSVGRDSDNEDARREPFHMHRLRSSRPTRKANLEHADSLSSGEEDDDDGFEILTAENLFSTLLSRVRSLTQRLNVEDNGRLGFPNTRLLGNFDHGSKLWNMHNDALSRFSPMERAFNREQSRDNSSTSSTSVSGRAAAPWRRSVSRDLATDIERVFKDAPPATATLPRDKNKKSKDPNAYNLDLSDLKLSEEDALALSYLTPGLSRRIQNQLFSQLPTRSKKSSSNIEDKQKQTFSDSSDSELFNDRGKYGDYDSDNLKNDYSRRKNSFLKPSEYTPIAESPIPDTKSEHGFEPKIYKLEDIKKEYSEKEKLENLEDCSSSSYTPYRHQCYRSTSLIEPTSYKSPLYYRNVNYSSENFDSSKFGHDKTGDLSPGGTPKFVPRPYTPILREPDLDLPDPTRRISRFSRPDYYDNCVFNKERKKREMETQKVLKEIRNKRINEHRDRYGSRDKNPAGDSDSEGSTNRNIFSNVKADSLSSSKSAGASLKNDSEGDYSTNRTSLSNMRAESFIGCPKSLGASDTDYSTNRNSFSSFRTDSLLGYKSAGSGLKPSGANDTDYPSSKSPLPEFRAEPLLGHHKSGVGSKRPEADNEINCPSDSFGRPKSGSSVLKFPTNNDLNCSSNRNSSTGIRRPKSGDTNLKTSLVQNDLDNPTKRNSQVGSALKNSSTENSAMGIPTNFKADSPPENAQNDSILLHPQNSFTNHLQSNSQNGSSADNLQNGPSADNAQNTSTVGSSVENTPSGGIEEKKIKRMGKISKLVRPKSYPIDSNEKPKVAKTSALPTAPESSLKSRIFKRSPSTEKSSPARDTQSSEVKTTEVKPSEITTTEVKTPETKKSNNQFLSSIEKKIRSFYSEPADKSVNKSNDKSKNETVNSRIQSTIRSLREQSEPRHPEHCVITESGLIKRAVSVEDFSAYGKQQAKPLPSSRKSVSKILGLFKKYEDKSVVNGKDSSSPKKSKNCVDGINKKIKSGSKTKTSGENCDNKNESSILKKSVNASKLKTPTSKLPVCSARNSSVEPDAEKPSQNSLQDGDRKYMRDSLRLEPREHHDLRLYLKPKSEPDPIFSPDESNDSWSICSDVQRPDMSPNSEHKLYSEEENESVSDRIRRKSFYCRFNEKKKPRKSSLVNNYKDYDLPSSSKSRSKDYTNGDGNDNALLKKSLVNPYAYPTSKKDSRLCKRALSMNDGYYLYNSKYPTSSSGLSEDKCAADKSLKPKRSLLQTPSSRLSERVCMSPPLHEAETLESSTNDISSHL